MCLRKVCVLELVLILFLLPLQVSLSLQGAEACHDGSKIKPKGKSKLMDGLGIKEHVSKERVCNICTIVDQNNIK